MSKKIRTEAVDHLFEAILCLKDKEECYTFFEDVCTINELLSLSQRFEVAKMLTDKRTYLDISEKTGASTATISGNSPREGTLEEPVYKEALTCAWQRFGYPKALAEGRTRILCSEEEGEMEYLAEEIRSFLVHKEWQGEVYKLLGDIRKKQGRTREAFENYFLALDHEPHPYIKNELSRIFLEDLYDGSRRTGFFAKKADVTEFLNSWLDKYKSQEELQKLLKRIL